MKGLIVKDFLYIKNLWKNMVLIFISSLLLCIFLNNYFLFISVIPIMLLTMGINTFQADEYFNSEIYTLTYPLSRKEIVISRYLFTLLTLGISFLIGVILYFFVSFSLEPTDLLLFFGICLFCFLANMLYYPIIYKYGCEKSSFVVVCLIIFILLILAIIESLFSFTIDLNPIISFLTLYGVPLLIGGSIVIFFLSMFVSIKIYEKQDF